MNQVKLFLAIMLAVGMMQLNGNATRSQLQNELQDKLFNFKNERGLSILEIEKAPVIQALISCLPRRDKLEDVLNDVRAINKFETELSHDEKSLQYLKDLAKKIKKLKTLSFYAGEEVYDELIKTCSKIIAHDINIVIKS